MKRFSHIFKLFAAMMLFIACVIFSSPVQAQTGSADNFGLQSVQNNINVSTQTTDLRVTIVRIINIFLGFLGLVAVVIVLYGGYLYMTSQGDEEQVGAAKKWLINGAIGFTIIASAFGITSFILSRLQAAVNGDGSSGGGDPTIEGSCSEPGTPYYEQYHNTSRCNGFCSLYPLQCCTAENFVVKSITPHTPGANEYTEMNNETIRVIFSKQVAGVAESVFKIYRKENEQNTDISGSFNFSFAEDGSIVEAKPSQGTLPNGEYVIEVNEGVKDLSGKTLATETSCGTFARSGSFKTGDLGTAPILDTSFGVLDPVSIDGNSGDDIYSLVQGQEYSLKTTLRDDRGNAYAYLRVYKEGQIDAIFEDYIDGPRLTLGSSKPFEFVYGIRITSKFTAGSIYVAEIVAHDIDGNTKSDIVRFRTVPPSCRNGVLDSGEGPEADQGGSCGSPEGNTCTSNSECGNGLQCLNSANTACTGSGSCTCKAVPYISDVQYMNGAAGNWVTIFGKNFGTAPGTIKFEYDFNGNGTIDSSVTASLAQCREGSVWNNSWIIAEVPPQAEVVSSNSAVTPLEIFGAGITTDSNLKGPAVVFVSGNYAYLADNSAGKLFVIDITTPAQPHIVGSVTISRAYSVYVLGNYAYVEGYSALYIVDITNKTSPIVVNGPSSPFQMGEIGARSVFVSGNYAYLANQVENSLRIIDVSNKKNPVQVGFLQDAQLLKSVTTVYVAGHYAYLASLRNNSLQIINVSDPAHPTMVGGVRDDDKLLGINSVVVAGQYAYVTSFDRHAIAIINVSDPAHPSIASFLYDNVNLNNAYSLSLSGTKLFVSARGGNVVSVLDVSNPEQAPRIVGLINNNAQLNQGYITSIVAEGEYAYVASYSNRSLRVIDATHVGTTLANNPTISVANAQGLSDSTNDSFGPRLGTFTYNTTKRPNLCSVTVAADRSITLDDGTVSIVHAGAGSAPEGTPVKLEGKAFGNNKGKITFGLADAGVVTWSGETINSTVPFGGAGMVSVSVISDTNEKSNPAPFTIVSLSNLYPPTITGIDPATTTKGSYITISGSRFGNDGFVYFTKTNGGTCPGTGCFRASALPASCGDTWSDTQIVAKVPTDQEFETGGSYFVIVQRNDGVNSSGKDSVGIVAGNPHPSICRIDPRRGFAPLEGGKILTLYGENFSTVATNPQVKFWFPLGDAANPDSWLGTSLGVTAGGASIKNSGPQKIETEIPYDLSSGFSMSSGPIKVKNGSGNFSNSVNYEVLDCREPSAGKQPGFQCCTEGPDAGRWKQGNFACAGSSREAGYIWRFTTGKAPQKFFVVESCSATDLPSPSPSTLWQDGKNICVNAQLQVKFNLPVDAATVLDQNGDLKNISVTTCGGSATLIDCNTKTSVTSEFTGVVVGSDALILSKKDKTNLSPNTWYHVSFSPDVASLRNDTELGVSVTRSEKIQPTRPCDATSAYCFDFRTGPSDFICTLVGAGMHPSDYTTHLLGVVQDPRSKPVFDITQVFNISQVQPLSYVVYGTSNLACTSLNVDTKEWEWGPPVNESATAKHLDQYPKSYGYATAWKHNPAGSQIYAKITEGILGNVDLLNGSELSVGQESDVKTISDSDGTYRIAEGDTLHLKVHLDDIATTTPGFTITTGAGGRILHWNVRRAVFQRNSLHTDPSSGEFDEGGAVSVGIDEVIYPNPSQNYRTLTVQYGTNDPENQIESRTYGLGIGSSIISDFELEIAPFIQGKGTPNEQKIYHTHVRTAVANNGNFVDLGDTNVDALENTSGKYQFVLGGGVPGSSILGGVLQDMQIIHGQQSPREIRATSTLRIDLGDPYAKSVWPSCIEACVNAEIGIEFTQIMNVKDFNASHITIRTCADENCVEAGLGSAVPLTIKTDSQSETIFRVYPTPPLASNTWYLVDVGKGIGGIRSIGGITGTGQSQVVTYGASAVPKQWKFKTKNSDQLCLADSVHIIPDPFFSTFIGQTQLYKAFPVGSPDSCSPYGQQLNPWNYGWNWKVEDTRVAEVTNFSFGGSPKLTCTIGCTPKGSDISRIQSNYPVCGNGKKESGEDCDIAAPGEVPGVSCTLSCLRPGNTATSTPSGAGVCGNGIVETQFGEECDPKLSDSNPNVVSGFCTNTCVNAGSSVEQTGDPKIPVCGSGTVTYGEDCDTKDPATQNGCSSKCLNLGTQLSQGWCDAQPVSSPFVGACQSALSVCGNGVVEQGEECEGDTDGKDNCSDQCLVQNACGTNLEQCKAGAEGCLSDCTFAGSSVTYSVPSVCGDGANNDGSVGIGEYQEKNENGEVVRSCELPRTQAQNSLGGNPVQVVTSVGGTKAGQSVEVVSDMETKVVAGTATARNETTGLLTPITEVSGSGEYHLQCGYTEYQGVQDGAYNNCPVNTENKYGVGLNSCCTERPQRIANYPLPNAGIGSALVCRNTYIEVTFDQNIPIQNLQTSIQLVQSYPAGYVCVDHNAQDVTSNMRNLLALKDAPHHNFFVRVWDAVKNFFIHFIRVSVLAASEPGTILVSNTTALPQNLVWCTNKAAFEVKSTYETSLETQNTKTVVSVYPTEAFDSKQYVVVLLNGGKNGIRNSGGVSIKSPFGPELSDYFVFQTGTDVCKIKEVTVEPVSSLFTSPSSTKDFIARAVSTNQDQMIVSMAGQYEWTWNWGPQGDVTFNIPSINVSNNTIASKGVRGHTDGVVEARITTDIFASSTASFSANFSLDALFCQRPWPASGVETSNNIVSTTAVFEDPKYNFSMYYCADSGTTAANDDLPYFKTIDVVTDPQELGLISSGDLPQALRRYLLFADKTDDAIGVQIFANPVKSDGSRQTLEEWYTDKFGDLGAVKKASIGGYDALTNEFNIYINAFNIDGNTIYNNIYLFSIDTNATAETKQVFQQLINSLRFNTNLTNHNRCLRTEVTASPDGVRQTPNEYNTSLSCTTDFDCRESSGQPKTGTNGFCSNAATKFNRDIVRLEQMHTTQARTDAYFKNNQNGQNFQLNLSSGTYIPGYTNSKWPSWGKLGSLIGGAPIDPVNRWVGCDGHDPSTCWNVAATTFKCPVYAQTYEYKYDPAGKTYTYYAPFEFIRSADVSFVSQYVDMDHIDFGRSCVPESTISPLGGQCGDGNINIGEECDPPGRSVVLTVDSGGIACLPGSYATATCNSLCKYTPGYACTTQSAFCGNGTLEGTEDCDAGTQNGKYGSRCTLECHFGGPHCGNAILDVDSAHRPLEFCENTDAKFQPGFCDKKREDACNSDAECIKPKITPHVASICAYNLANGGYRCSGYSSISCTTAADCKDGQGNPLFYDKTENIDYGKCLSLRDSTYDIKKENSCAWDCQSFGSYCGDGTVQKPQEECDQGAQNGTGTCTSYCKLVEAPDITPDVSLCGNNVLNSGEQCDDGNTTDNDGCSATCTLPPRCGDAKKDAGEQCDTGTLNGTVCTPGYGTSCTYCTNSCTNVTIDAVAYCGNGKIDSINGSVTEACDYRGTQVVEERQGVEGDSICPDKGLYSCSNSCTQLQNNCVSCGVGSALPIPKMLVLNPMLQPGNFPSGYTLNVSLYRKDPPNESIELKNLGGRAIGSLQYATPFPSPYPVLTNPDNNRPLDDGIQTNPSCNGEYAMLFNKTQISSALSNLSDERVVSTDRADLLDYAVNGEGAQVTNEVVVSPAVPEDTIRIVTRWKKSGGALFTGQMYQDKNDGVESPSTIGYIAGDSSKLCGNMVLSGGFYIPSGCNPVAPSIWMHKILDQAPRLAVQAITLSANGLESNSPIGFYVTSPNGPINQYTDYDLWVDVYEYHSNQVSQYSMYQPTYSFSIKNAIPSANVGPLGARYWHVFNLTNSGVTLFDSNGNPRVINGKFALAPIGSDGAIVTDTCQVRASMPDTTQCPTQ